MTAADLALNSDDRLATRTRGWWLSRLPRVGTRDVFVSFAVGVVYYISAQLGLELSLVHEAVTPLWPPTGVAVVAFFVFGRRMWPAVALAAFVVNLPIAPNWWAACLIAGGNTIAPLVCATLLRRLQFDAELSRLRDASRLVALALATTAISATIGTLALSASDGLGSNTFADGWWVWWTGDAMGVLIVAPFLWSLWPLRWARPTFARAAEVVLLFALLIAAAVFAARSDGPWLFVVLPPLMWIAWRFQRRGAGVAALIASVVVILAAVDGDGPFLEQSLLENMATLQLFNAAVSFTSFFFAAAVMERQQAMDALYRRQRSIAETLQGGLLPGELANVPGVALCARYVPARREARIGGDWYDVFTLDETTLGLVVGDVAGHGFGASTTMAALRAALRSYAIEMVAPDEALGRLNHFVNELYPDVVATVLYGRYDTVDRVLDLATAGHPLPLRIGNDGATSALASPIGPPLGVIKAAQYRAQRHTLDVNDTVLAFTDGLVERRDRPVDEGIRVLCELGATIAAEPSGACDVALQSLLGDEIPDDVALLSLRPMSFLGEHLTLKCLSDPNDVARMRRVLRRWLLDNGATQDQTDNLLIAASEAHANALVHAYEGGAGTIKIDVRAEPPGVVVTVRDYGHWLSEFTPRENGSNGRGIPLMRALVETVEITSNSHGTEVRLRAPIGTAASAS